VKTVKMVAMVLVIIGALNWLLVGALETNLVETVLGEASMLTRAVYVLVGAAGLFLIYDMIVGKDK